MEANENENTTLQNLWHMATVATRGEYIAIKAFFKKEEKSNTQLNLIPKEARKKKQQKKAQNQKKENNED